MNLAWQTPVVFALAVANTAIALIAANTNQLNITSPWIVLVAIPVAVFAGTLAANQLKAIGSDLAAK